MRRLIFALLLFALPAAAQEKFTINGTVDGLRDGRIMLLASESAEADTIAVAAIEGGRFTLAGDVPDRQVMFFALEGILGAMPFFPEAGEFEAEITVDEMSNDTTLSLYKARVSGNSKHALYNVWQDYFDEYLDRFFMTYAIPHERAEAEGDMARATELEQTILPELHSALKAWVCDFIGRNSASDVAAYLIYEMDGGEEFYAQLSAEQQYSPLGRTIVRRTEARKAARDAEMKEGGKAPADIALDMPDGATVTVGDVDARIRILAFWAIGCQPCIQQIPAMKQLYAEYSGKGLKVIYVFTWGDHGQWLAALEKYDLPWINAFESNPRKPLERALGVHALPHKVVLDADNNIIALNPSISHLHALLRARLR